MDKLDNLFLAQEKQIGMTAGTCVEDGGKVRREIVGVPVVKQARYEGHFQCDLSPGRCMIPKRRRARIIGLDPTLLPPSLLLRSENQGDWCR